MRGRVRAPWVVLLLLLGACGSDRATGPATLPVDTVPPTTTVVPTTSTSTSTTSTTTVPATTTSTSTTTVPPTLPPTVPPPTVPPPTVPPPTVPPPTVPPPTVPPPTYPPGQRSTVVAVLPGPAIALTFDAGSDVGYTELILDTLAAKGVVASFGITGDFAADHPDVVRRMAREGHVVMNHSYTHASFTGVSSTTVLRTAAERQADLRRADAVLADLVGHSTVPYWRPPYGDYDAGVLEDVGAIGYAWTVMWTIDSLGWKGLSADQIVERVLARAVPGAIVAMHVGSQSQDGPALARMIDGLRDAGYSFTTVAAALAG